MTGLSETSFNLIDRPWIPILDSDGQTRLVSLHDAFARAGEIRDLACGPAERVSLLRLLICIAQAAQDTPQRDDSPEWEAFTANLPSGGAAYLSRAEIKTGFELLGDGPRFLQFKTARFDEVKSGDFKPQSLAKLSIKRASGNNPTVWDHEGEEIHSMNLEEIALSLLTFLNFSCLTNGAYPGRAPCINGNPGHVFSAGETLREWIGGNCISKDAIIRLGHVDIECRPIWELASGVADWEVFCKKIDHSRIDGAFLPRLTPISRALWLLPNEGTVVLDKSIKFRHLGTVREFSTAIRKVPNPKQKDFPYQQVELVPSRKVWRDLPAFLGGKPSEGEPPATLHHSRKAAGIWIGGIVTGKSSSENNTYADDVDSIWVDAGLLADPDMRLDYQAAMQAAEAWEKRLDKAVCIAAVFYSDAKKRERLAAIARSGKGFGSVKLTEKDGRLLERSRRFAKTDYWNSAEYSLPVLFAMFRSGGYPEKGLDDPWAKSGWHTALREAAKRAYRQYVSSDSPRQIEAFAFGLGALNP
jgi:CRISPR system Cascade subunit CasA